MKTAMKRHRGLMLLSMLVAGLLITQAWAAITSESPALSVSPGKNVLIPLQINATEGELLAGINGQFNYDPAIFSEPDVAGGPGSSYFLALGNEVAPGQFRFVLYADPTRTLASNKVVLYFSLRAANPIPGGETSTVSFSDVAASTPDGVSLSTLTTVNFQDIEILLNENAAQSWQDYR